MGLRRRSAVTVAIGGGKGGVGKSVVASNLAISVARLGARVVVVDADLGAANQHTLFGVDRPGVTLQALVEGRIASLEEAVVPTSVPRVQLVPGSGAVVGAANIGHARKMKLIRHIHALEADVVIVDCGAGSGFDVVDLYDMADLRFVVVAPQLTSMQNAYAFLKSALFRSLKKMAFNPRERELLAEASQGSETEQVSEVIDRVRTQEAVFADALEQCVGAFEASLVGNMLDHPGQKKALGSLSKMFRDFLDLDVPLIASLPRLPQVHRSVTKRRPFLTQTSTGPVAKEMLVLAEKVLVANVHAIRSARRRTAPEEEGRLPGPLANYIRAHDRFTVDLPCTIEGQTTERWEGRVLDAGPGGLRIDFGGQVQPGDRVQVQVGGHRTEATVMRVADGEIGVEWQGQGSAMLSYLEGEEVRRASA